MIIHDYHHFAGNFFWCKNIALFLKERGIDNFNKTIEDKDKANTVLITARKLGVIEQVDSCRFILYRSHSLVLVGETPRKKI